VRTYPLGRVDTREWIAEKMHPLAPTNKRLEEVRTEMLEKKFRKEGVELFIKDLENLNIKVIHSLLE